MYRVQAGPKPSPPRVVLPAKSRSPPPQWDSPELGLRAPPSCPAGWLGEGGSGGGGGRRRKEGVPAPRWTGLGVVPFSATRLGGGVSARGQGPRGLCSAPGPQAQVSGARSQVPQHS
ncbi:uncharacterized protein LOC144455880 [Phascolarctos cinereus]